MIHLLFNNLINSSQHGILPRRPYQSKLTVYLDFKTAFDSIFHT